MSPPPHHTLHTTHTHLLSYTGKQVSSTHYTHHTPHTTHTTHITHHTLHTLHTPHTIHTTHITHHTLHTLHTSHTTHTTHITHTTHYTHYTHHTLHTSVIRHTITCLPPTSPTTVLLTNRPRGLRANQLQCHTTPHLVTTLSIPLPPHPRGVVEGECAQGSYCKTFHRRSDKPHVPTQQQCHLYSFAKCCRGHHSTRDSTLNFEPTFAVSDNTTYSLKEGRSSKVSRESNDVRDNHFANPCMYQQ